MRWSPQQARALDAIAAWTADKRGPQVFRLFGYAGTGKSTLATHFAAASGMNVLFGAFTGKAALVMRQKGCDSASTLHSLVYKPQENERTGEVTFILNPDSPLSLARLLVVDEVSMVGPDLAQDILSFGCRVLVLGDPFQLPPVNGTGYFTEAEPDIMLTEIHRQAADNPIVALSAQVRAGGGLKIGDYGDSRVLARADIDRAELGNIVLQSDQVICGRNQTRRLFNTRMRQLLGFTTATPATGERLICLKNNRTKGLLNGGMWQVASARRPDALGHVAMKVDSLDEDDMPEVDIKVPEDFFTSAEVNIDWRERRRIDEFTYGYAITCHKAQGSQWDDVTVFDESAAFREHASRHLYTAITRAAERVTAIL